MNNRSSSQRTRHRKRGPRCIVEGCKNPRAVSAGDDADEVKALGICWPHISAAARMNQASIRRGRIAMYERTAKEQGKKPEDIFWDPEIFESQMAQEIQNRHNAKRALEHYWSLVNSGKIKAVSQPAPSEKDEAKQGHVYYLRVGSYIKIGWSLTLEKRMRSYPPDSVLLATEPGTRKDEQKRHRMFAAHRTHGREWYAMTPSVMHHIEQVAAEHGTPDAVTFAAKPVEVPQPRPKELVTPRGWTGRRVS